MIRTQPSMPPVSSSDLTIAVRAAVGRASTTIAAFDRALMEAGVGNFNLVRLSSIIPPDARVLTGVEPSDGPSGEWGDRLYCVYAAAMSRQPHEEVWAGLGWVRAADGRGLFVEHEGHSQDEVEGSLHASLADMASGRREEFGEPETCVVGAQCRDTPAVCALVIAPYQTAPWQDHSTPSRNGDS